MRYKYREEWFVYTTEFGPPLAAVGAAQVLPIRFATEADFKAYRILIAVLQADVAVLNFGGTIQIRDEQVGRDLFSNPMPITSLQGTGERPHDLAPPRVFNKGTTLLITLTSNVVTSTKIAVSLEGAFLYPVAGVPGV